MLEDHQLDIRYAIQVKRKLGWDALEYVAPMKCDILKCLNEYRVSFPKQEYRLIRVNPPTSKEKRQ